MKAAIRNSIHRLAQRILDPVVAAQVHEELDVWFSDSRQAWWRQRVGVQNQNALGKDFWHCETQMPALKEIYEKVCKCPASSASAERMFAAHSKCHTDLRASLSEDGVREQLLLHTYLNGSRHDEERIPPQETPPLKHDDVYFFLTLCAQRLKQEMAKELKVGTVVTVYFNKHESGQTLRSINNKIVYSAVLKQQRNDETQWDCDWYIGAKRDGKHKDASTQPFDSIADEWEILS